MVVQDALGICNRALAHLAVNVPITSLTDTVREESVQCALWYEQTKAEVLREFPWPFAWKYAALTLVDGTEDIATTQDFQYAYRLPADVVRVHRILGDDRASSDANRIAFSLGSDAVGGLLYTDVAPVESTSTTLQQPQLEYTASTSESDFPPDFAQALSLKLAFYMAPVLTKGDAAKLGLRAAQVYQDVILSAKVSAARESQLDAPGDSEFITARL